MNTEITDNTIFNGWVLYDGNCHYCRELAEHFDEALTRRRFKLAPLQSGWVRKMLCLDEPELLAEMRLLRADGRVIGGADALLEIGRQFWWLWPVRLVARIPGAIRLLRAGYRWVARRRYCAGGACELRPIEARVTGLNALNADGARRLRRFSAQRSSSMAVSWAPSSSSVKRAEARAPSPNCASLNKTAGQGVTFFPALLLPLPVLIFREEMAPWIFMWAMAFALYAGCKWITYCLAAKHPDTGWRLKCGYLFAWPGMNAAEFLTAKGATPKPDWKESVFAMEKIIFGVWLVWCVARMPLPVHPLLAGWIGMIGVVFILHFGVFDLVSIAWRVAGVNARPVMQNPLLAKSLADFWGARWNTAFNELAFRLAYRPLRRATNPAMAILAVFGLSGLIHELVISLPARGGYGLPTLYFLGQGIGMLMERSTWGRTMGLGHGLRGWIFTLLVTAGPAFWLFHPPFIHNVILPMLTAIGAT